MKKKKCREKNLQIYFSVNHRIFAIVCCVTKVLWILTDSILSRAGSLAKSTAIITNIMRSFTVTLFHFPRIVMAAVCTGISIGVQLLKISSRGESNVDGESDIRFGNSLQTRLDFESSQLRKISEVCNYQV